MPALSRATTWAEPIWDSIHTIPTTPAARNDAYQLAPDVATKEFAQNHADRNETGKGSNEKEKGDVELGPDLADIRVMLRQVRRGRRDTDAHDSDQNS